MEVIQPAINPQRSTGSSNHYFIQDLKTSSTTFSKYLLFIGELNSVDAIATRYGLDGEGIES